MYILTNSGRQFSFTKPTPESVYLPDIAHALSHINRFTGHAKFPYSVAQHSLAVSHYLAAEGEAPRIQLAGLLHDAHEAYFGDVTSPLKAFLGVKAPEDRIQAVVAQALGLNVAEMHDPRVKLADLVSLAVECETLLPPHAWDCLAPVTVEMRLRMGRPMRRAPEAARDAFIQRYHDLQDMLALGRPDMALAA